MRSHGFYTETRRKACANESNSPRDRRARCGPRTPVAKSPVGTRENGRTLPIYRHDKLTTITINHSPEVLCTHYHYYYEMINKYYFVFIQTIELCGGGGTRRRPLTTTTNKDTTTAPHTTLPTGNNNTRYRTPLRPSPATNG